MDQSQCIQTISRYAASCEQILSRKIGQSIVINGNVIVKVVRVDGDQIKLGIDAPKGISVHREEVQRAHNARLAPGDKPSGENPSPLKKIFGLGD